ncbi:MAG: sulfite exporter TauE/SafE family protein [Actinobacteria bacterium]|nr:sulfite exporter TauE/SafE family protein [Actinomycetota bacterium]
MSVLELSALVAAGVAAGFINTVAGGGSVISIPIMVEIIGAGLTNGTLRVAILLQNISGVAGFARGKAIPWGMVAPLLVPTTAGAVAGAWLATRLSAGDLKKVFAVAVVLVAVSVLIKPKGWDRIAEPRLRQPWTSLVFLGVGFYGGFVQAGVGFLFLAALVPGLGLGLVKGNGAKVALILGYLPFALLLFISADQVHWGAGALVGAGSMVGALLASTLAVKKGAGWIRWVLVAAAIAAALRMLLA